MKIFAIVALFSMCSVEAQTPPKPPVKLPPMPQGSAAPVAPPSTVPVPFAVPGAAPSAPADFNKVILTIGNEKITAGQYDDMLASLPPQVQTAARGPQKRQFVEQLVLLKLLSQEAVKRKVDQKPAVQKQLAFQRDNLLAGALYQDLLENVKVDTAAAQKYYEEHKSEYEQVKGRHILIRMKGSPSPATPNKKELTEDEALAKAQEIRKKLVAGEDFATLAKAESDDTGSGANGGDLGFFKRGQMVPPFEQAAYSLPVGQISEAVKSQFGYHIIKIDRKDSKTFDEVREEIEKKLRPEIAKAEADDLRKKAPVMIDDSFFGPPAPPAVK